MGEAVRIRDEIHEGKITFNEAAFKYSEDKAGAYGLLGDKAQHEVRGAPCCLILWLARLPPNRSACQTLTGHPSPDPAA